jgi:hypothetical protein
MKKKTRCFECGKVDGSLNESSSLCRECERVVFDDRRAVARVTKKYDAQVWQESSLVLIIPITGAARSWLLAHVVDALTLGNMYAVETRYAQPILAGMAQDGLSLATVA